MVRLSDIDMSNFRPLKKKRLGKALKQNKSQVIPRPKKKPIPKPAKVKKPISKSRVKRTINKGK